MPAHSTVADSSISQAESSPLPSNRHFGTVFTVFFVILGLLGVWRGWRMTPWYFGASGLVGTVTIIVPSLLAPFNRWWMALAGFLHKVVSPIMLGLMFFAIITPVALFMRLAGRDEMKRRWQRDATTYWVPRDPPGPPKGSLNDQF